MSEQEIIDADMSLHALQSAADSLAALAGSGEGRRWLVANRAAILTEVASLQNALAAAAGQRMTCTSALAGPRPVNFTRPIATE